MQNHNVDFVTVRRRVRHYGIRTRGLDYCSPELLEFLASSPGRARDVQLRVSRADLRTAHFRDPRDGAWLPIQPPAHDSLPDGDPSLAERNRVLDYVRRLHLQWEADAEAIVREIFPELYATGDIAAVQVPAA